MIALLLDHLWQSSVFVGGAGLIGLALRRNSANVRFWLWFAASIKFLVPFAALTALSTYSLTPIVPRAAFSTVTLIEPLAKPFSASAIVPVTTRLAGPLEQPMPPVLSTQPAQPPLSVRTRLLEQPASPTSSALLAFLTPHLNFGSALPALWAIGFLILAIRWFVRWSQIRALLREATEMQVDAPLVVKSSASRLEPGLFGILHPVILLPHGIQQQLSPAELQAVLAHELCHWRRHDNLLAAIHMLVEALFWFFPLVWWVGARLNTERERACDENVLSDGNDPQVYAEGILKVCHAYLQSPLACVAGISGGGLKQRIGTIMENRLILQLNAIRKLVLGTSAAAALALPLALGLMAAPITLTQAKAGPIPLPTKNTQGSTEQALHTTPGISTAALPTNRVAENSAGRHALQADDATASANEAPSSPHLSRPLPSGGLAVPSRSSSQLLLATPTLVASNDLPTAPTESQPNASAAAAVMPPNDQRGAEATQTTASQTAAEQACTLPKIANTAPLEQLSGTDLVTVPVAINGKTKQFLLDIGVNKPTEVSPETKAELGLPENLPLNQAGIQIPVYDVISGLGSWVRDTHIRISSFTVGGATGHHLQFVEAKKGEIARLAPYAGFLTGDFFRQYDVELDFAGRQLTWLTPTKCTDPNQVIFWPHSEIAIIPVTLAKDGRLQMQAMVQGHIINAEIDTSSPRSVMRRDIAELYVGLKAAKDMIPVNDLEDGMHMQVYVHTFPEIIFAGGGITALNVPVLIQDYSMRRDIDQQAVLGARGEFDQDRIPDLVIGMDVLQHLHMYVVPSQGRVYVTSAE